MGRGRKIANVAIVTLFFLSLGTYLSEGKILEKRGPIPTKAVGISPEIKGALCARCCSGISEEYTEILDEKVFYRRSGSRATAGEGGAVFGCIVEIANTGHEIECQCSM
ncbi:MAG: hypothetical protein HY391_04180 [Deltaproteobacteria bacterium]|nr:hypothetical protein [Deltaproteobacteria bacterium]